MFVKDRLIRIQVVCEVCQRQQSRRPDPMGFLLGDADDPYDWLLQLSTKRLGRDDAEAQTGGSGRAWGRLKAPAQWAGPRRNNGTLRPPRRVELRVRCLAGHRLHPSMADLEPRIADAVERRLPCLVLPEGK